MDNTQPSIPVNINWPELAKHFEIVGCSYVTDKTTGKTMRICSVEDIVGIFRQAIADAPATGPVPIPPVESAGVGD